VFVPATDVPFRLDNRTALTDRVLAETSDGTIRMGTFVEGAVALRYVAVPFTIAGAPQQAVYLAAYDIHAELADTNAAFTTYTIVAALALLVIGLVGWFVAGRLLRPIRNLRQTASRITATDRTERIPVMGNDDVSALTTTVNDMLDRLDESLTAQRQLLDDVRHELKTPITIVRGHLELTDPEDPTDVRDTVRLAIDELDRMSGLVDDIEALAISEQRGLLTMSPTDVDDLTRQVFAKASALADHNWILDSTAPIVATLDARRVTQALLQLADNAAKYSGGGSRIRIGSASTATELRFWVADDGPGIPIEAQARIFERFGRAATGRGHSGSGLGLAIVGSIAAGHGGAVSVDSTPGRGSTFTVSIPLVTTTDTQHAATQGAEL
jgi:signal transduction histidine kinase